MIRAMVAIVKIGVSGCWFFTKNDVLFYPIFGILSTGILSENTVKTNAKMIFATVSHLSHLSFAATDRD
jgi:hypothetical protein